MGQEIECRLQYRRASFSGKAYLETDFLLFRGTEQRLKIQLDQVTRATSADGWLKLEYSGEVALLELGRSAEIWAHKILHPPSLLDKLGVKPGIEVAVLGDFEQSFLEQIPAPTAGDADIVFLLAEKASDLKQLGVGISRLKPHGVIWVVYPKGVHAIRENEVIEAGRLAGLRDTKVARYSTTHTALRFSQPRGKGWPVL